MTRITALLFALFGLNLCFAQPLLSEAQSANTNTLADEFGEYDDWIEIHNPGTEYIDLSGLILKDAVDTWTIPVTDAASIVGPGGYFIIWADDQEVQGMFHTNFKLSAVNGEFLGLYEADGETLIDSIELPPMNDNESHIRCDDGNWQTTNSPSPYEANGCAVSTKELEGAQWLPEFEIQQISGQLTVLIPAQTQLPTALSISSMQGQELLSQAVMEGQNVLDMAALASGVYLFQFKSNGRAYTWSVFLSGQ